MLSAEGAKQRHPATSATWLRARLQTPGPLRRDGWWFERMISTVTKPNNTLANQSQLTTKLSFGTVYTGLVSRSRSQLRPPILAIPSLLSLSLPAHTQNACLGALPDTVPRQPASQLPACCPAQIARCIRLGSPLLLVSGPEAPSAWHQELSLLDSNTGISRSNTPYFSQ